MRYQNGKHRTADEICLEIAQGQDGILTRSQALGAGMSSHTIARRVASGRWLTVFRGVYAIAGVPSTPQRRLRAACLYRSGVAAFGTTAAALFGLDDFQLEPIHVVCSRALKLPGIQCHKIDRLERRDITFAQGIPATTIHRTLLDLGARVSNVRLEDALDCAFRRGLSAPERVRREAGLIGTRGRKGPATTIAFLDEIDGPLPSWLERRFIRVLKDLKMSRFVREFEALGNYRIDFAWPRIKLGVEVHGAKWHVRKWQKDLRRHNELTTAGWTMLHFTYRDIRDRRDQLALQLLANSTRLLEVT